MAKKNKKEVVEETTDKKIEQPIEEKVEQKIDESKFQSAGDDSILKVDLSKPPTQQSEEVEKQPTEEEEVVVVNEEPKEEVKEEIVKEEQEEIPIVQEVTEEEVDEVQEEVEEAIAEAEATGKPLPEQLQKVVEFMNETGGDLNDYVNLNRDISKMDDSDVLDEYYRNTKSHLTAEERNFLLEESFGYDEEVDDAKQIRKKKIALKEQVAEAKAYLDRQKSKYYEEIKAGSGLTPEAKKAMDFFNRYNKENEEQKKRTDKVKKTFLNKTNNVFNEKFKGFDYEVGDKKFRFNVKDVDKVKTTQSDLNNFVNKFVGEDKSTIEDAKGYHKSLFTAMNADAIAKHFYEQGKADAIKGQVAKDKNINIDPRQTHGETEVGGLKYKVLGNSANDFKFKIKRKK
tara:strand:+ start:1159 stop:2355 length:1197 start_codon:yes stop_codon:yes gene_type:complete